MSRPQLQHYRAIVVGAGRAGVMAAIHASRSGPVLLCDSSTLPRNKSCGGMLNDRSRELLSAFGGVPKDVHLDPEEVRFRYVDWDRGIRKETSLVFANVDGREFDGWLLELLPDSVELVQRCSLDSFDQHGLGVAVRLTHEKQPCHVSADYLIGADGARSRTRRLLGVGTTSTYVTVQDIVKLEGSIDPWFDCIHIRGCGEGHAYTYVVPKGDHAIIGSVHYPGTQRPRDPHETAVRALRSRIGQFGECLRREGGTALAVRKSGDLVLGLGRVLLTGEAAGFISPSSGEGISYALDSGSLAGRSVAGARNGEAIAGYAALTRDIGRDVRRRLRWLPVMESRAAKYAVGFVPSAVLSKVTEGL